MIVLFGICLLYSHWRPEVLCKKDVLRNFEILLCQSLTFNKVSGLRLTNLLKKRPWHRCFSANFVKFWRAPFIIEGLWWLLLKYSVKTKMLKILQISQENNCDWVSFFRQPILKNICERLLLENQFLKSEFLTSLIFLLVSFNRNHLNLVVL